MRGADAPSRGPHRPGARFIPTCVGQMEPSTCAVILCAGSSPHAWGRCRQRRGCAQHPRVHPHMRGADRNTAPERQCSTRFIPTCVGQMDGDGFLYGIKFRFIPTCVGQMDGGTVLVPLTAGSSPHAWGRFTESKLCRAIQRFIPTCVGQIAACCAPGRADHGSSPHAWGRCRSLIPSM